MASPFSGIVLGSGALLASPALWAAFVEGAMSMETAVVRLFVGIVVSWVGISLLSVLLTGTAPQSTAPDAVPRALASIDGPISVRGAVVDSHLDEPAAPPGV